MNDVVNFSSLFMFIRIVIYLSMAGSCSIAWGQNEALLQLQVGEVRVLAVPNVARVAVGDGHVLNAVTTSEKEVILFARHEGYSAVHVWSEDGLRKRYRVEVAPEGSRQVQQELRQVLERIESATVSTVGDKLLIEGDELSDADRQRVAELADRYPQLLDFTGQVGWDRMVLLDVQVLELPQAYLNEFGLHWGEAAHGGVHVGLAWDGGSSRLLDRPGEVVVPTNFAARPLVGYFGLNALLSARVKALTQTGDAVVLAQPQLLARSGTVAEFLAGGEVPYSTVDANGNVNTEFKSYGVSLHITPQIERNDIVRSRVEVEVSAVDTTVSAVSGPALKTRRAATEFNVKSGQTLVLAGFLSREHADNTQGVSGLSQIPLLGALFKSRRFQRNETELAIFVTPHIISADEPRLQARVAQADVLLNETFPQAPRLNRSLKTPVSKPWDPWSQVGSQWRTAGGQEEDTHDTVADPL